MANDIDALKQFNDEAGQQNIQAQTTAPQVQSLPVDQLKQFNDESEGINPEEPSIVDKAIGAAASLGRGAIEHAKNVVNLAAGAAQLPEPFQTNPEALKAEAESLASGITLGGSRLAENYILGNQADQQRRANANRDLINFGSTIGNVVLAVASGGLAAPIEALGAPELAASVLGGGAEAGLMTAGNVVSDQALGDPDLNAQKLISALYDAKGDIGMSAIFGGGIGAAAHTLGSVIRKNGIVRNSVADAIEKNQSEMSSAPPINPADRPVEINPDSPHYAIYQDGIKITNLAQMEKSLADAKAMGLTTELPQKAAVIDAESRLGDLKLPLNKIQVDSLDSQGARDKLGIMKQLRTKGGGTLADFEAGQKAERLMATDEAIKNLAPGAEVTSDLAEAGNNFLKTVNDNYEAVKAQEGPILNQLKSFETVNPLGHQAGVVESMANRVPGVSRMFDTSGDTVAIKPYSTLWGIDRATYDAVSQAYKALEEPANIRELLNVRDGLAQNISKDQGGNATNQIVQLRAGMMDYIQNQIARADANIPPESNALRNSMKNWAVNEQQRELLGKTFGAPVGSPKFNDLLGAVPEKILPKIFANSATVRAAKQVLGEQAFNEVRANYLAHLRAAATTDKAFSSNKFYSSLNKNRFALHEALSDPNGEQIFQRINDLNTTMRNFPDAVPTNPSKTGSVIHELFKNSKNGEFDFGSILGNLKEVIGRKGQELLHRRDINNALQGKSETLNKLSGVQKMTNSTDEKMDAGIRAIMNGGEQFGQRHKRQGAQ